MTWALDDIEEIRENMRRWGTGRTAVYAKRFKPLFMAEAGVNVHRTRAVRIHWGNSGEATMIAWAACRGSYSSTAHPAFFDAHPPRSKPCKKCFPAGAITPP